MEFEGLSTELKEKVQACKTAEEILALAQEEGYELSEAELNAVSAGTGGWSDCSDYRSKPECPGDWLG